MLVQVSTSQKVYACNRFIPPNKMVSWDATEDELKELIDREKAVKSSGQFVFRVKHGDSLDFVDAKLQLVEEIRKYDEQITQLQESIDRLKSCKAKDEAVLKSLENQLSSSSKPESRKVDPVAELAKGVKK